MSRSLAAQAFEIPSLDVPKLRHFDADRVAAPAVVFPALSLSTANAQEMLKYRKQQQVKAHQKHPIDTGSSAVQVAVMTEKILALTRHMAANRKDFSCRRGLEVSFNDIIFTA
jgi:ribosomal protein S15P/S13E